MKKPKSNPHLVASRGLPRQSGLSLADWLVGQALAAMVVLAALSTWGFAQQNHTLTQEGLQQAQQMSWVWRTLGQHIRQAGAAQATQVAAGPIALSTPTPMWAAADGTGTLADSLTTAHLRSLEGRDCQGNTKGSNSTMQNRFTVNTKSELTCLDESNPSARDIAQNTFHSPYQRGCGAAEKSLAVWPVHGWHLCPRCLGTHFCRAVATALEHGCTLWPVHRWGTQLGQPNQPRFG